MQYNNYQDAAEAWLAHRDAYVAAGLSFEPGAEPRAFLPESFRRSYTLAMDAQPALATDPSGGIPALMTTYIDPQQTEILFAPLAGAQILGESRMGTWVDQTAMFRVSEHTGEVSSYGDYSMNGRADVNLNFPQRQAYLFQTFIECGDLEVDRAGAARFNLVAEKNAAAATVMNRALNTVYHFGVAGLQNYGLVNDPNLLAALTPSSKTAGGVTWFTTGGAPNATANEVFNDFLQLFETLVSQTGGIVTMSDPLVLALSPQIMAAMAFITPFGLTPRKMVEDAFPNLRIVTDTLYGARTAANPQGITGGNLVQMIAERLEGQETGTCAFNEKMRAHRVVMSDSSFRQKKTTGAWGAVLRQPFAIAQMLGV